MANYQVGDGDSPITFPAGVNVGFYGITPVAQRATTSVQLSSNLSTISSGSLGATLQSAFNANQAALQEVMATLKAYGLWGTN
jgi:hypothetical protein